MHHLFLLLHECCNPCLHGWVVMCLLIAHAFKRFACLADICICNVQHAAFGSAMHGEQCKGGEIALCLLAVHEVGRQVQATKGQHSKSKHSVKCHDSRRPHVECYSYVESISTQTLASITVAPSTKCALHNPYLYVTGRKAQAC